MHIKTENVHLNSTDIRRIYYEAFLQEIIIANGEFIKKELRWFFAFYSNGTVWPKIWKQTE